MSSKCSNHFATAINVRLVEELDTSDLKSDDRNGRVSWSLTSDTIIMFIEFIRLVLNGNKSSSEMPFAVIPYRQ